MLENSPDYKRNRETLGRTGTERTTMSKQVTMKAEERAELVLRLLRREEPAAQLARRAGISEQTLYRWRDAFLAAGTRGLGGGENPKRQLEQLAQEVAERDRVIGELTIANRVLKKVSGGLS